MIRLSFILGFGVLTLLGTTLPWDVASTAPDGLTRLWPFVFLPAWGISLLLLLGRRQGSGPWLLAALCWVSLYPVWIVYQDSDRLLEIMAQKSLTADRAYLWSSQDLAIGKLVDQAKPVDLGSTPGSLLSSAPSWLAPGYWVTLILLLTLALMAIHHSHRQSRRAVRSGMASLAISLTFALILGARASHLSKQWNSTLEILASPEISPRDFESVQSFTSTYPVFLANPTAQALLLRTGSPLPAWQQEELSLLTSDWPYHKGDELLACLELVSPPESPRTLALRRIWWNDLLRDWTQSAAGEMGGGSLAKLHRYLEDDSSLAMGSFLTAYRDGRWIPAAQQGEALLEDHGFSAYHASIAALLGDLYTANGNRKRARVAWERSFETDSSNNDAAIRGLGAIGP